MDRENFKREMERNQPVLTDEFIVKTVREANEREGEKQTLVICAEECAELIQEITKAYRGVKSRYAMLEEIADVLICLESLLQLYRIKDEDMKKAYSIKLQRIAHRNN